VAHTTTATTTTTMTRMHPSLVTAPGFFSECVLTFLKARDAVRLGQLGREWRAAMRSEAGEVLVRRALARWPHCQLWRLIERFGGQGTFTILRLAGEKEKLETSARQLHAAFIAAASTLAALELRTRAPLPRSAWPSAVLPPPPGAADAARAGAAFEAFMLAWFHLCATLKATARHRAWRGSATVAALRAGLAAEAAERPGAHADLGARFCKEIYDDFLGVYDHWEGGYIHWDKVPWRRSAIEFFREGMGPAVADAFGFTDTEVARVDLEIRDVHEDAMELVVPKIPAGVPESHWWFRGGSWVRNH